MTEEMVNLGSLVQIRGGKRLPAGKALQQTPSSHPYIRVRDVGARRLPSSGLEYIPDEVFPAISRYIVDANDVVISIVGTIGALSLVDERYEKASLTENCARLTGLEKDDALYLYYYLASQFGQAEIHKGTVGAVQPKLPLYNIEKIQVRWPKERSERAHIAHILGTLDDKIELNRRMNETLEAIPRAIFKSWFVDFDPVRAIVSGEAPESICCRLGLTPDLLALFPDRLVNSELGEIPEGWRIGTVDEEFDLTMGQSPPGNTYNEAGEGLPFYQGRTDFGFRFPSRRIFCTAPTRFAEVGDTLISVRAPVGDINMADERCCIGRGVAAARHKTGSRSYTYYFMQSIEDVFNRFEAEGTVFGAISKKDFHNIERPMPPSEIVHMCERLFAPIDDQIDNIAHQSQTLSVLRDALLPKLLSGELRLPVAGVL